jgi:hypothetical protein
MSGRLPPGACRADRITVQDHEVIRREWDVYIGAGGYAEWQVERQVNGFGEESYRLIRVHDGGPPEIMVLSPAELEGLRARIDMNALQLYKGPPKQERKR